MKSNFFRLYRRSVFFVVNIFSFFLIIKIHEIKFITCHLVALYTSVIISMSIMRFLKLIDGIPGLNGQLISLVPSAASREMNQEIR